MKSTLFREEAMSHQQSAALGEVVLAASPAAVLLSGVAALVAVLVIAFAWFGEFTRKAHVTGYITPDKGLIKVYAPAVGTVVDRRVSEGQQVGQGEILAIVSTERSSLETTETRAAAIELLRQRRNSLTQEILAQQEIDALRSRTLVGRIGALETEHGQLDAALATQRQRLASAEDSAARFAGLETKRFVAATQAHREMDEALEQRSRLQELERDRIALESELRALRLERMSAGLEADKNRASLQRRIAELQQELTEYESDRNMVVTAPAEGVATAILVERGQRTGPETPLLSLIPSGAMLEAQLLVPSRAIGFVAPGQTVALRYQAFPYQRFGHYGGTLRSISKTLVTPDDAKLPVTLDEPVYLVTVALDSQTVDAYGHQLPLQVGMLLEADIWLDRRSVIQWVLDPLYSLMKGS